jgi:hypothetical protein
MEAMELPLDEIVLDPDLNLRDRLDPETVERYAEAWERMPPVAIYEVDGKWLLVDGFHRHAAAVSKNKRTIPAFVQPGSIHEALDYAAGANLSHGLPLSRAERRRAVEVKLRLHPEMSDRNMAKDLGVGRELIARVRTQLVDAGQIPAVEGRVGADGKVYPATSFAKDPNEHLPRGHVAAPPDGPPTGRGRNAEAPWDDTRDPMPAVQQAPPFPCSAAPWEDGPGALPPRDLARSGPVAVAAPTIDEMLDMMTRQVMEIVSWIEAEGFHGAFRSSSKHARGLFLASVEQLNQRVDDLTAA